MLAPAPISKTSFIFAVIIIAWCTLSVLPVYLELGSQTARIVTTILGSIPILLVWYRLFKVYIVPTFTYDFSDPQTTNLFSFLLVSVAWIFSWATIYTIFWVWDPNYFSSIIIYNNANAYSVFLYMLSGATGAHVADTPLYLDVENPWLSVIISIQSFLGTVFNICVISLIILLGAEYKKAIKESFAKKHGTSSFRVVESNLYKGDIEMGT